MALLGKPNIARLESKGNAKGLMRALSHADPAMRSQAALALGRLRAPEAVGPLISAMLDDHNSVAVMATQALGEIGEPAAVEALVVMLGNAVPERRVAALRALGQIGNEPAIDGIAGVLRGSHTDLDEHAIAALARLGPERLPRLLTLLEDSDQRVADAAAAALRQMGAPAQAALESQAQAKEAADAERAVRALGRLRTPAALASLVTMLHTGAYTTRAVAQEVLLSAGTACIAPLEAAIAGSDLNQQRAAVQALGASALPEAVSVLAQVVTDGAKPLARAAIQALGALSQAAAAPTLLDALDSDDWLLRQHAADGLGRLTLDADGKARLAERLYDGTAAVRKAALQSLEAIKWRPSTPDEQAVHHVAKQNWAALRRSGAAAVPALARMVPLLLGGDRTEAVAAMAAAGPAALEPLIALLSHSDVATRAAAAEGLGALGDARAVPALIAELERGDSSSSGAAAATALGTLGAAEAADALEQAVRQGNASVRAAAAGALAHLGARGERALLAFAASDNAYIVRAAIAGLGQLRSSAAAAERLLDLALDQRQEVQQEAIAAAVGLGAVVIPAAGARLRCGDRATRLLMADLLGHLGDHRAADALIRALWHSDPDTGPAAARALEMLGVPQLDERFGGDRVATLYALTLARVELDDSERHWLEGEALGDLAAANPALDTVHARIASGALPLVSDSAVVGPFGHSLVSMQALFKAWLLGRQVTLPAWDGWFYHRTMALEDEQSPHVVVLCYYRPSA
ncbi:MAG: HEAT repeat domain-containing protein [Anaerolineae bacterium]|jgi:HEAT repeat protein